jgi:hypothetical protein
VREKLYINEVETIKETTRTPEYQHNLKDHLGNVRLTFTTQTPTTSYTAGYGSLRAASNKMVINIADELLHHSPSIILAVDEKNVAYSWWYRIAVHAARCSAVF